MIYGQAVKIGHYKGQVILSKDKNKKLKAVQISNYERGLLRK